jgi:DNA-binding transcriptional MerR regulator
MVSNENWRDPKRFIEGLKEKGLSISEIEKLAKRAGEGRLTEDDRLIMARVRSEISGKEV